MRRIGRYRSFGQEGASRMTKGEAHHPFHPTQASSIIHRPLVSGHSSLTRIPRVELSLSLWK
jgi:hypothetical protein